MKEAEYQAYLDEQNRKYVSIDCSEIPRKVVLVVRAHYEKKGVRASEEAILNEARDKYDMMYLMPDGKYKHEVDRKAHWRKYFREKGIDPDEVEKELFEYFDKYYENLKVTDPAAFQEWLNEARRYQEEVQKLNAVRQARYRDLHGITEQERIERVYTETVL